MIRSSSIFALLVLGACATRGTPACSDCNGPAAAPDSLIAHAADGTPRVSGVVLEADRMLPLEGAQVSLVGTTRGTLTNAQGWFSLELPPGPELQLLVQRIAMEQISWTLRNTERTSYAARIVMETQVPDLCDFIRGAGYRAPPPLEAQVRDIRTGRAPIGAVRLTVRGVNYTEEVERTAASRAGTLVLASALNQPGRYSAEVTSANYHPWSINNLRFRNTCEGLTRHSLIVWLMPKQDNKSR